ncbi:hypothetical protein GKR41_00148 [Candidatus Vallotia lariciata]|nr:hypothetical protein GKR41_00148 [Candidatus Vallotia lariciata]
MYDLDFQMEFQHYTLGFHLNADRYYMHLSAKQQGALTLNTARPPLLAPLFWGGVTGR